MPKISVSALDVTVDTSALQDVTATQGTFSDRVQVTVSGKTTKITGVAATGALVDGAWVSGHTDGLNITPNDDGIPGKKLVLGYFDGTGLYRSAIEYANTVSGLTTVTITPPVSMPNGALISHVDVNSSSNTGDETIGGTVSIGGTPAPALALGIVKTNLTSTVQIGAMVRPVFNSAATAVGRNIDVLVSTQAASFTLAEAAGIYVNTPSLGAGSAITTLYGVFIANQTGAGTNYALKTNGGRVGLGSLPTSASGLAAGDLWNNSGVVHIV
jgi:hypothetical protein